MTSSAPERRRPKPSLLVIGVLVSIVAVVAFINTRRGQHQVSATPTPVPSPSAATPAVSRACAPTETQTVTVETVVRIASAVSTGIVAVASRCSDSSGIRNPTAIRVIDRQDDDRVTATLLRPDAKLHLYSMSASPGSVTVSATDWSAALGDPNRGALYRQQFATSDGLTFTAGQRGEQAPVCTAGAVTVSAAPGRHPNSVILRLTNRSSGVCVVEGYPSLVGQSVTGQRVSGHGELAGPGGGVGKDTAPPVLLVEPGKTVSAAVESAAQTPAGGATLCTSLTRISVALAAGPDLGSVPAEVRVCDFQAHPFVAGSTGSDS